MLPLPESFRNAPRPKAANVPRNQESVASARDPKKHATVKGSKYPEKSRACCLCQRPSETRLGQRQQISREIKNVLPLPETRRNMPRSKAANIPRIKNMLPLPETRRNTPRSKASNVPRNQESVAFTGDQKKCAMIKGGKYSEKSRMCCLCRRHEMSHD